MVKMIFCRSKLNIADKPVADGWAWYRPWIWATLIWLSVTGVMLSGSLLGWAADEEDWQDAIYFPQRVPQAPAPSGPGVVQTGSTAGSTGNLAGSEKPKKGIWPFRHKAKPNGKNQKPPTDEQITQVGPKDPAAYPDPLLRLNFPIQTEAGTIQPGFYLVRQVEKHELERTLVLTRQHQVLFMFNVSAVQDVPEGPIQPSDRTAPPKMSVDAELSADQKTLTLVLTEGSKRYESAAFLTVIDTRKILAH